jgi:hypothetical protein
LKEHNGPFVSHYARLLRVLWPSNEKRILEACHQLMARLDVFQKVWSEILATYLEIDMDWLEECHKSAQEVCK